MGEIRWLLDWEGERSNRGLMSFIILLEGLEESLS
jgi:hypothetical protein